MLRNMSLGAKLISGFMLMVILIMVGSVIAYWGTSRMMETSDEMESRMNGAIVAHESTYWAMRQYRAQADLIINKDVSQVKAFEDAVEKMDAAKEEVIKIADMEKEFAWIEELNEADESFDSVFHEKIVPKVKECAGETDPVKIAACEEDIKELDEEADAYLTAVDENLENLAESYGEEAVEAMEANDSTGVLIRRIIVINAIISVIAGFVLGVFLTRSITGPINRIIADLSGGSEQVTAAAGQISSASQQLAEGAAEQASSLEEISSSLEEMSGMTNSNADSAETANQTMATAKSIVEEAGRGLEDLIAAINEIQANSQETGKIIKSIDEIAFQTNLLALNAAVEAARAGEAGKGFAVVAEEVRNLAQRAGEAARNTSDLIESTINSVKGGVEVSSRANQKFSEQAQYAQKVAQLLAEIAASSKEQAQGIEQVSTGVNQMDKVTQTNASNAEESASAAEEMNSQAEVLNSIVAELSDIIGGAGNSKARLHNAAPGTRAGSATAVKENHGSHFTFNSTHVPERMAKSRSGNGLSGRKPEHVIPLDNDKEFQEF